jgi:transposase
VELLVETRTRVAGCPQCGVVAQPHASRPVLVWDLPAGGRPVVLVWSERLWRCRGPACPQRTWAETSTQVARPRGRC